MHGAELQVFDQRGHILGKAGNAVVLIGLVGAAMAAQVDNDHPVQGAEHGDLRFPIQGA